MTDEITIKVWEAGGSREWPLAEFLISVHSAAGAHLDTAVVNLSPEGHLSIQYTRPKTEDEKARERAYEERARLRAERNPSGASGESEHGKTQGAD